MTDAQRHYNMSRIRGKNTSPELKVRKALHGAGFRFRVNVRRLPGTPDIVLAKYRTCIFVNGCFWHGHDGCRQYTHPKTNQEFWEAKVRRNKQRDELDKAKLESMGWFTYTVWECELRRDRIEETINKVISVLHKNQEAWIEMKARRAEYRAMVAERRKSEQELLRSVSSLFPSQKRLNIK